MLTVTGSCAIIRSLAFHFAAFGIVCYGIAAAHARLGQAARETQVAPGRARRAETVLELTAQRPIAPWLNIQPDLQYVIHPGWAPGAPNTLIFGLRFSLAMPDS